MTGDEATTAMPKMQNDTFPKSVKGPLMKNGRSWLIALSITSAALWIPILFWLNSPDRTVAVGPAARLLLIFTVVIQLVAVIAGVIYQWAAAGFAETRARNWSVMFGWVAYLAALTWAWWASMSMLKVPDIKLTTLVMLCAAYLIPAVIPVAKGKLRASAGHVAASATLIATALLTAAQLSPILIAPATVYVIAVHISGVFAHYASVDLQTGRKLAPH